MTAFSERFKSIRKEKKITQRKAAEIFRVNVSTISRWEKAIFEPDTEKIREIADYFQVSTDYLIGNTDDPTPTEQIKKDVQSSTPDLMKILSDTKPHYGGRELTKEEADMLIDFLEFMLKKAEKKKKRPN